MDEILARLWQSITGRLTGPTNLRLIVQPAVATIHAIRAGIRDSDQNPPSPFFWAVLLEPGPAARIVATQWKDGGKVLVLAMILDVICQLVVHRGVASLELPITAVTLAIVPDVLAIRQPPIR